MADTSSAADRHPPGLPAASRAWKTACRRWVLPTPEGPYRKRGAGSRAARRVCAAAHASRLLSPTTKVSKVWSGLGHVAEMGRDGSGTARPSRTGEGSPSASAVEARSTRLCGQRLVRPAVAVAPPVGAVCRPSRRMDGATSEDSMNDVTRRRVRPGDQRSIERAPSDGKKKNRGPPPSRKALLVGDLAPGEELEVGDQLAHRGARLARVAVQLPLELEAPAVA